MKKFLSLLLVAGMLASMTACSGGQNSSQQSSSSQQASSQAESSSESAPSKPAEPIKMDALYEVSKNRIPNRPSLVDEKLKEMFNVELNWIDQDTSVYNEKINTLLASDDYPEVFWNLNHPASVKNMGLEGYLVALNPYLDSMPNYKALWSEADFQAMLASCSSSDGNLYFTPTQNYRTASMSWVYYKSEFDKNGWEVPKDVQGLYELLKTIKAANPEAVPMSGRGKWSNAIGGLRVAYGVTNKKSYVDPYTNEFVPYGYVVDGMREAIKWGNTFYAEKLIPADYMTYTDNEWTADIANGRDYIEYQYVERAQYAETNIASFDPNADYDFTSFNISADPSKGYVYERENSWFEYGYSFSDKINDVEGGLEAMLGWIDWVSTDEGSTFFCMGEEGKTYEKNADGTLQFMPDMYHATRNPEGKHEWEYGLYMGITRQSEDYTREVGKDTNVTISKYFNEDSNAHYTNPVALTFTTEEESRLNTLDTQIDDVADEYINKFIMGTLNPADDNDWNAYLAAMNNAGLEEASKIRTDAYNRGK